MIVWSIANQKGGVGKTTTTVTLAGLLSERNKRVLLVDTDPHSSLTTYLNFDADALPASLFDLFQLGEISRDTVRPLVLNTQFKNIDIIPAHMSLAMLDRVIVLMPAASISLCTSPTDQQQIGQPGTRMTMFTSSCFMCWIMAGTLSSNSACGCMIYPIKE